MSEITRLSVKSYNNYLRESAEQNNKLILHTQSQQELQSVLEAIQMYVKRMNTGKAKIEILRGMININIGNSKEMLS